MKKITFALMLFISFYTVTYSAVSDTSLTYSLHNDGKSDKISMTFNEDSLTVTLKVNSSAITYYAVVPGESRLNIIKTDDKNLIMVTTPDYYGNDCVVFSYGNKIDSIGEFYSFDTPEITGNGIIKASLWMGFWSAEVEYILKSSGVTLKYKDEYAIPPKIREYVITTTDKIFLHSSKMMNAKGLYEIPKGVRVYFMKADIKGKCPDSQDDSYPGCNWYYLRTSTGTEGWIMEREFVDKLDGIPYAG